MTAALQAFAEGYLDYLLGVGTALLILLVASAVYILLTPWKELTLVKDRNGAAGLALAGAIAGLAIPIASALASSVQLFEFIIWAVLALLVQLLTYRGIDLLLRDIPRRIREDEAGAAIVLVGAKISASLILAAGLWDPNLGRI